ncbi:G2-specific serine/threonine protein kinase [Pleurotus pulmonarius]|nr:G2-specific serine/threonine protein kinase [Pleurotus pulmonarius]KAF4608054.1 G2-specific serine/threonine protein kinase [Pleurotus pulmonarius]
MSQFLELYDPLDIIGNGSFGIIRKVRRKTDGMIFARKELNFERMTERDRKQIVAEVNILKDLHHDHIVRYHDRYVDKEAGILYILMEYCGGGDLSGVIKQAQKHNRPISEDAVWNFFLQILLALQHCHHPNGHSRSGSTGLEPDSKERRPQILHRDLKPDNVFLDEANAVKLGDFGLSKALAQSNFANTYVGTPYYMSPELMQEKAYDSKSDIWSLGCLIYELCALKPPFHEAKTHAELSILIRNGRVPPLPRGYSQTLSSVIKTMLNLNPAMRPSAAQLLQHERLVLALKISDTEKMLHTVKIHKSTLTTKEREILAREAAVAEKEAQIASVLSQKDAEIIGLKDMVNQLQQHHQAQVNVEARVREAVAKREDELRIAVAKREEEVAAAMVRREEEIMGAIRKREAEISEAWKTREEQIKKEVAEEVDERVKWVIQRTEELSDEEERLETIRLELEERAKALEALKAAAAKKEKSPLEEIKNLVSRATEDKRPGHVLDTLQTPIARTSKLPRDYAPSAMKGVVLTTTGEALMTPSPAELAHLFDSPRPGLDFAKIFDFHEDKGGESEEEPEITPPPSPSKRDRQRPRPASRSTSVPTEPASSSSQLTAPPTRLRRPSIRSSQRPGPSRNAPTEVKPLSHPHLQREGLAAPQIVRSVTMPVTLPNPPKYDLEDEENLPSPFLKKTDKDKIPANGAPLKGLNINGGIASTSGPGKARTGKRTSTGNLLRTVAAANNAVKKAVSPQNTTGPEAGDPRPSVATARKAGEEARKALSRS